VNLGGTAVAGGERIAAALQQARSWLDTAQRHGGRAEFDRALAAASRALALCPFGAPERFAALITVADVRAARYEALHETEDLAECARVRGEIVALARERHPADEGNALFAFAQASVLLGARKRDQRPIADATLAAKALSEFAARTGDAELHRGAAEVLRHVVSLLPADHPDRAALAALRAAALIQWMDATGDLQPLDTAAEEADRAVRLCPPGNPNLLPFLSLRNDVRRLRHQSRPTAETLDAFLESSRQVLDRYPAGHPVAAVTLTNVGQLYRDRFKLVGDPADLDNAAHHLRLAVQRAADPAVRELARTALDDVIALRGPAPETVLPPNLTFVGGPGSQPRRPPERAGDDPAEFARHSAALTGRLEAYERTGDLDLLDQICADGRTLLAGLPPDHPERWLIGMPLGPALMRRYEEHGEAADLDEAVALLRAALARPTLNPDHVVGELINLAAALINRFLRYRGSADLDEAITCARRAVEIDPTRTSYLNTLGTALTYRFQHTGRRFDLDDAIETGEAALARADSDDEVRHARANLGNRLRQRFHTGHEPSDLDEAVHHLRAARDPAARLNLALTLADRADAHGGREDRLEAVELYRSVLAATPAGTPLQGPARLGLAEALAALGRFDEAVALLDENLPSQPFERMDALILLARLRTRQAAGDWTRAAEAWARAVSQLPVTVWRGLPAGDRNELITRWWDAASDAAAVATSAGAPERAVELLEHGRSIWWNQLLDTRTDQAELESSAPDLARRLTEAAAHTEDETADARLRRARDWDKTLAEVRAMPGFRHFLTPVPFTDLTEVAVDGPVVLVNISRYRCDAFVLRPGVVQVVPLPDLTGREADERTHRYLDAVARTGVGGESVGAREQSLLAYLEWLWDVVAEPVLKATAVPPGSRLWWCATGPLALAPLHAAGYHDPDDTPTGRTVLDRVISSMTPTLRALRHARRPHPPASGESAGHRLLVVAYADRPAYVTGLPALPFAAREAAQLRTRFPAATVLTGDAATRAGVTDLLRTHTCAHFACHGVAGDATGSPALFLADGPLTITDLGRLDVPDGQLVVLTACHTAMGDTDRPDEAGHLAAALQVSGYRHVVSTLWAIGDTTGATVAEQLYEHLAEQPDTLRPARAAEALHTVVRNLRDEDPYRPTRWAPFLHFGA
jgi:tetratricopeptide (TPR) repeat protein